jgi:hypothetical protein
VTFWHTVLAVVLGHAIYDLMCMIFLRDEDDDDEDDHRYA